MRRSDADADRDGDADADPDIDAKHLDGDGSCRWVVWEVKIAAVVECSSPLEKSDVVGKWGSLW